jgi:hypothetical protein
MEYNKHLYAILYPSAALVGSQLSATDFAHHFITGSSKFFSGKLIFAEIDGGFRNPYFPIEESLAELTHHEDGRPKATKYISTYRVLEHLEFSAIKKLYISTPEGHTLELAEGAYDKHHEPGLIRVYAEISPISMMLLSDYNFADFGKFITDPKNRVGAPAMFYTQIELEVDEFLKEIQANPLLPSPIPDLHPGILSKSLLELKHAPDKHTKGLSPASSLGKVSFRNIRHGFMFASQKGTKFFPMPDLKTIEEKNFKFWKTM